MKIYAIFHCNHADANGPLRVPSFPTIPHGRRRPYHFSQMLEPPQNPGRFSIANEDGVREAAIVPLAVPLLAGPAAFSYIMGNSARQTYTDLIHVVVPILVVGIVCWITFYMASQAEKKIRQPTMDVVQRVGGLSLRQ